MGVVYKANHHGLKRLVALKMIRGGSQARANLVARFRTEAEAVARLRHPNIVQIYDIGEADGLPFVALELLEGGSLGDRLAGEPQAARQAAELADAPGQGRPCGAPGGDRPPRPQAVERALHASTESPRSPTSAWPSGSIPTTGTPRAVRSWARPATWRPSRREGTRGTSGRRRTSMPWEPSCTRCSPAGRRSRVKRRSRRSGRSSTTTRWLPSQLVPRVPRDLETISLKCLHKDPARRYPSAQALADDLYRYLHGQVIHGPPDPVLGARRQMVAPPQGSPPLRWFWAA